MPAIRGLVANNGAGGCCWSPPFYFTVFLFQGWAVCARASVCVCVCVYSIMYMWCVCACVKNTMKTSALTLCDGRWSALWWSWTREIRPVNPLRGLRSNGTFFFLLFFFFFIYVLCFRAREIRRIQNRVSIRIRIKQQPSRTFSPSESIVRGTVKIKERKETLLITLIANITNDLLNTLSPNVLCLTKNNRGFLRPLFFLCFFFFLMFFHSFRCSAVADLKFIQGVEVE